MNSVKISILVPVYKAEKYIGRCAKSLFGQTFDNLEFVFVDDCTPDRSIEVLKSVLSDFPHRMEQTKIISHDRNRGVAAARNTLLANATGDYLLWVDADDFITKDAVKIISADIETSNADIVCFNSAWYDVSVVKNMPNANNESPRQFIKNVLCNLVPTTLWGKCMKRCLFTENDLTFIEGLDMGEDMLALVEIAYYSKTIFNEETVLYYQDISDKSSLSRSYSTEKTEMVLKILEIMECFFRGKMDFSVCIQRRKLDVYLRKLFDYCIVGDKYNFKLLKSKVNTLKEGKVRPLNKTPYSLFLLSNNYVINRILANVLLLGKSLNSYFRK